MSGNNVHVIHVITTIDFGGAEKQLAILTKNQVERGMNVMVLYLKGKGELRSQFKANKIQVERFTPLSFAKLKLARYREKGKGSHQSQNFLIHAHLPLAEIVGWLLSLILTCPLILTKHNAEKFWPRMPDFISKFFARIVHSRARFIICISNHVEKYLIHIGDLETIQKKSRVIYYGINHRVSIKESEYISNQELRILLLTRLEPQKDISTFLRAAQHLSEAQVPYSAKIYGDGSLRQSLIKEIELRGIENEVCLEEKVGDVEALFARADILVLPSIYEGFGLVLLEAAQNNLMILAADNPTVMEITNASPNLLFPVGDDRRLFEMISMLSTDQSKVRENLKACAEFANKYDASIQEYEVSKLYAEVLKK
jgi:glycosyltransferase involved in cell wall biosynthesis